MQNGKENALFRRAAWVICGAGAAAGGYWLIRVGLPLLLPFLLAWGMARILSPLTEKMHAHTRIPKRICAFFLMLLTLLLLGLLVTLAVNRLIFELQRLFAWLEGEGGTAISGAITDIRTWFAGLSARFPFLSRILRTDPSGGFEEAVADMLGQMLTEFSGRIPAWIAAVLRGLPAILLFVAAWILACFYFCLDLDRIHAALRNLIPLRWRGGLGELRRRAAGTALRWLRAYLLLLALTFGELLVGFSVLGVEYAFLLALLIALIDVLPILGVGTVLIPWALVMLAGRNYRLALGLIVLYAVILIVRQIAEPRIVGGSIGLHPLLTLAAMYIGFRLFGVAGMLLSPAVALALSLLASSPAKPPS